MNVSFEFKGSMIALDFTDVSLDELTELNNALVGKQGVYLLRNIDGDIIYVGISNNVGVRVRRHVKGTSHKMFNPNEIASVAYYVEDDDYEREALEMLLIRNYKPLHNKTSRGLQRVDNDKVIAIKYVLGLRKYKQYEIANMFNVSAPFVSNVNTGVFYSDIKVPEGYTYELKEIS